MEMLSALLALYEENSPYKNSAMQGLDVSFVVNPSKLFNKQCNCRRVICDAMSPHDVTVMMERYTE